MGARITRLIDYPSRAAALRVLAILLVVDFAFLCLHVAVHDAPDGDLRLLSTEAGYAAIFGYAQEAAVALLLLMIFSREREPLYLAWAFTFAVILADDAWTLHERGGIRLADAFGLPSVFGLRPIDLGEMLVWSALGVAVVACLVTGFRRSGSQARIHGLHLATLFAALLGCAVVLDMAHGVLAWPGYTISTLLEDGGELMVLSSALAYVIMILLATTSSSQAAGAERRAALATDHRGFGRRVTVRLRHPPRS